MKEEETPGLVLINKKERANGWSWPLHPYQLVAWFFLVSLPLVYYGALVPHLPKNVILAGCFIPGLFLLIHIILHLICLTLDPADPKTRQSKTRKATEFNRNKHKHVIENDHCYICQVNVGTKSKHCALCNKCISDFDHHCKWLNNCIGGQNYKLFIGCLTTALVTALTLLIFCLYLFIMFFKNKDTIMSQPRWEIFGKLNKEVFISLAAVMIALLILAIALLSHLLCFHIFLIHRGLSTYDFIVQARQTIPNTSSDSEITARPPKLQPCKSSKIAQNTTESVGNGSIEVRNGSLLQECKIEMTDKTNLKT